MTESVKSTHQSSDHPYKEKNKPKKLIEGVNALRWFDGSLVEGEFGDFYGVAKTFREKGHKSIMILLDEVNRNPDGSLAYDMKNPNHVVVAYYEAAINKDYDALKQLIPKDVFEIVKEHGWTSVDTYDEFIQKASFYYTPRGGPLHRLEINAVRKWTERADEIVKYFRQAGYTDLRVYDTDVNELPLGDIAIGKDSKTGEYKVLYYA